MHFDRQSAGVRRVDGGMVTVELAACLPVLVLLLAVALSAVGVVGAQVRVQDAAREAARAAARGDSAHALDLARVAAPGASVVVRSQDGDVVVTARLRAHLLASWLPVIWVSSAAVAAHEP
jgi:Flp pilus assembly protein TadG